MKKVIAVIMFVLVAKIGLTQNLVPNPSYEDTVACPFYYNQMNKASGWNSYRNSPDYFNNCNNTFVGVPINDPGYQGARTGNAYGGFISYISNNSLYREWLGCQLIAPLIVGRKYFVKFFVSMAYKQNASGFHINGATNKIGIRFSTIPYSYNNTLPLDGYAQIFSNGVISDTINWTEISGSFIADSMYSCLIIGNFFDSSAITWLPLDSVGGVAYYYVDDVSVIEDTSSNIINPYSSIGFIKIYPNPAGDWIMLEGKDIKLIEITNTLGSNLGLYITTPSNLQHKLDLSSFSRGIYFIKINTIDGQYITKKIILQN
jgi:hypothetical protein